MQLKHADEILIRRLANRKDVKLGADVFEKDFWLTYFLEQVTSFSNEVTDIIFCGGTSLAKTHCVIDRMSEDADFKIISKENKMASKSAVRKSLKETKEFFETKIEETGFKIIEPVVARDENRFFSFKIAYEKFFPIHTPALKQYLQIECIHVTPLSECVNLPVYTIADRILGNNEPRTFIKTLSLEETVAEKTVALLRRIGDERAKDDRFRPYILRHVYDLVEIFKRAALDNDLLMYLVKEKIIFDQMRFKNHFPFFVEHPVEALLQQLDRLHNEPRFADEYFDKLNGLMYIGVLPDFYESVSLLDAKIRPLILSCKEFFVPKE